MIFSFAFFLIRKNLILKFFMFLNDLWKYNVDYRSILKYLVMYEIFKEILITWIVLMSYLILEVKNMSNRATKKVVLDAGHGGTDPGTIANGSIEKDYTLKISDYIHKRLDDLGIENSMSRTTDETLSPDVRPGRVQSFYGKGNDVIVVSNHINAGGERFSYQC